MNDKTYADGGEASCICEGKFATDDGHAINCPAGINYQAWQDRTVRTNTSEATAIGARDVVTLPRRAAQALLDDLNARIDQAHLTAVPVFAGIVELHAALSASPKPDTNTSVDPGALSPQQDG